MVGNSWHDVSIGEKAPAIVNMIVEIPKGSRVKYELDKKTGLLKRDRVLYSAVVYPGDYGFVPQTYWEDGDPLDIIVMTYDATYPNTLCEVKVIGVVRMTDNNEEDDKLIAVYSDDPRCKEWTDIHHIPQHFLAEIRNFFETYTVLQKKKVVVFDILGVKEAQAAIKKGQQLYNKKFKK